MSDPLNRSMSDPFKEFVEEMARLTVPEDGTEENRRRREAAASKSGTPISDLDESDIVACADDEFLCSEALALWAMIPRHGRWPGKPNYYSAFGPTNCASVANVEATGIGRRPAHFDASPRETDYAKAAA